ncbi:MAG: helix-turn-helix domain-containing protein [Armatimonadota bacterium]
MRTLEDWFKYLEQQYVDEKAQKESKPPQEQTPQKQEPAQSEPTTSRVTSPSVQEQRQQEVPRARPAITPPSLEQVQVVDVSVPDPADYIFTLRRPASEPAKPADAEEEAKRQKRAEAVSEAKQPAEQMTTPAVQEQATPPAEEAHPEESRSETVAQQTERARRAKPVKRAPYTRSVRPVPPPQSIEDLWKRVPKHVRLLVELGDDEVTQRYYDRQFKESRQELVERLLNPSLTLEDTARLLGVCPTTVRRYTERGLLNHYRTPGNQRRFRLSDVIAFLEARQQAQEARRRKR